MTTSGSPGRHNGVLIAGAILLSAILLIFFLPDRKNQSSMQSTGSTYGRILVDSPEVYTRERMVNDRFRQEAWLLEQLDNLTEEEPGVQGVVEGQKSLKRKLDMLIAQGGVPTQKDDEESMEDTSSNESVTDQGDSASNETRQPQLTPIEVFRGRQAFGEEIRNAIIENQLDDRHDLGGNTLYRLKFDATVIPGDDTSAWALINVQMRRDKGKKEDEELRELYNRWMDELREQVNESYREEAQKEPDDNTRQAIYDLVKDGFFYDEWGKFKSGTELGDPQCMKILEPAHRDWESGKSGFSLDRYQCVMKALEKLGVCSDCEEEAVRWEVLDQVVAAFGTTLGQKADLNKQLKAGRSQPGFTLNDDANEQRYVAFKPDEDGVSILVTEYTANFFAVPVELNDAERQTFLEWDPGIVVIPVDLSDKERDAFSGLNSFPAAPVEITDDELAAARDFYAEPELSKDEIQEYWTALVSCDVNILVRLDNRSMNVCRNSVSALIDPDYSPGDIPTITAEVIPSFDGQPTFVGQMSDDEIVKMMTAETMCDDFVQIKVNDRLYKICESILPELTSLDGSNEDFSVIEATITMDQEGYSRLRGTSATVDKIIKRTWSDVLNCNEQIEISISERLYKVCKSSLPDVDTVKRNADGITEIEAEIIARIDGQPEVRANVGFYAFKDKLQKSDDEKFLFSYAVTPRESSQQLASSSRLSVAAEIQANASGDLGSAGVDIGTGNSSLFSEYARIMERRPIIVGVASHPDSGGPQSAEFGWLIGPKLVVGTDGMTTYRHLPSQNSLAALVSAPGWWRRANIEITTGWLDSKGNMIAKPDIVKYEIALPGDQQEITSALLRGGKRPAPNVDQVTPIALKVDEKAKIMIEGQNLWRSTVVTIGAQRSKRIFVLPNMKGIIAEFDEINAQETRPDNDDSIAELRVWTSEGVASWDKGIKIEKKTPR